MNTLIDLYNISAPSRHEDMMVNYIEEKLNEYGATTYRDAHNNLYATKGISDTYPCVVAHTDEVHNKKPKNFSVFQVADMLIGIDTKKNKYVGIGADDKNGIWVALETFRQREIVKGAFFVSEEIGCVGSSMADMEFFDDCRFVLQCDRRGSSDFISNASGVELSTMDFVEAIGIEQFGYREADGMMTDVMQLKQNGLGVCCANISCGYYNPHTDTEYTVYSELENALRLVLHIVDNLTEVYPHEYEAYGYRYGYGSGYGYNNWLGYGSKKADKRDYDYGYYSYNDDVGYTEWGLEKKVEDIIYECDFDEGLVLEKVLDFYISLEDEYDRKYVASTYEWLMGSPLITDKPKKKKNKKRKNKTIIPF